MRSRHPEETQTFTLSCRGARMMDQVAMKITGLSHKNQMQTRSSHHRPRQH